jgi:hypothetical protein
MSTYQDIEELGKTLAAWGSRTSGNVTAEDRRHAESALAAIDRLTATLGHVRAGVVREMETERTLTSWRTGRARQH